MSKADDLSETVLTGKYAVIAEEYTVDLMKRYLCNGYKDRPGIPWAAKNLFSPKLIAFKINVNTTIEVKEYANLL